MESNYNIQVMKEAFLYILEKEGKVRYYALMKTLYLAERDHLAQWGGRITQEVYHPLPYGPVPSGLYDALKSEGETFVSALRKPNMEYLSQSEVYALDRAIQYVRTHNFEETKQATHDKFYQTARKERRAMTNEEISLSGGVTPGMVAYINEQTAIDQALV